MSGGTRGQFPSLGVSEEACRQGLDAQVDQIKGLDNKSGVILGASGIILAVLAGPSTIEDPSAATLALFSASLTSFGLAALCAVACLWPRTISVPPNPVRIYEEYLEHPEHITRLEVVKRQVEDWEKNEGVIDEKACYLRWSARCFLIGLALLMVLVVYDSAASDGGSAMDNQAAPEPTAADKPSTPTSSPQKPATPPPSTVKPSDPGLSATQTRGREGPSRNQ